MGCPSHSSVLNCAPRYVQVSPTPAHVYEKVSADEIQDEGELHLMTAVFKGSGRGRKISETTGRLS